MKRDFLLGGTKLPTGGAVRGAGGAMSPPVFMLKEALTKFILSLPYQTDISYKERLQILGITPLCYWHEYLDIIYIFKSLINDSDRNISVKVSTRETRSATNGTFLNVGKCKTVNYQNSYYNFIYKEPRACETLFLVILELSIIQNITTQAL
jgi:hypothetical protein